MADPSECVLSFCTPCDFPHAPFDWTPLPHVLVPCTAQQRQSWFVLGFRGSKEQRKSPGDRQVVEAGSLATKRGWKLGCSLEPGMGGWPHREGGGIGSSGSQLLSVPDKGFMKSPGNAAFLANNGENNFFQNSQMGPDLLGSAVRASS